MITKTLAQNSKVQSKTGISAPVKASERLTVEWLEPRILLSAAFDLIGLTALRADSDFAGIDGSGIGVAIIDSGLDQTHPLLSDGYVAGYDYVNNDYYPNDPNGHGTHVAGIVGGRDSEIGVATDVNLIGLRTLGENGNGSYYDVQSALDWVYKNREEFNIKVINMSLGDGAYISESQASNSILYDDIHQLEQVGITVVSAGGNSYKNNEFQNFAAPAIFSTLAVGAVWETDEGRWGFGSGPIDYTTGPDRVTSFSQRLVAENTIFAPGALILSTVPGNKLEEKPGTSMASPMVAGCVALMQEAAYQFGGRYLSPDEIVSFILTNADFIYDGDDEDNNVDNTYVNYPRINIYNAISDIKDTFEGIAPPPSDGQFGDPNGTIIGAYIGPQLNGSDVNPIHGTIGYDGGTVYVGGKDVDIIRFDVLSPGSIFIETKSYLNSSNDFDTVLRIFDGAGNELAYNDDISEENTFSRIEIELALGIYYAGISGYGNTDYNPIVASSGISGETGYYTLEFSLQNDDPNGIISGAVFVNFSNSNELNYDGYIGYDYGSLVGVSDVDLFEIYIPDDGTLYIDIDTPFETDYVDSYLRLFDQYGNLLYFPAGWEFASDDDLAYDNEGFDTEFTDYRWPDLVFEDEFDRTYYHGHTTDSFLGVTVNRGAKYYIGVSDFFNDAYDPTSLSNRLAIGDGGSYDLYVSFFNKDLNGTINQVADQTYLPLPVTNYIDDIGFDWNGKEWIDVGDLDVDIFKIRPEESGILEVDIDSYYVDPNYEVDTVLFLFDSNGEYLAGNDDDLNSLDPLLQYDVQANNIYHIAIVGYGNDNFDPFQLASGSPGDNGTYYLNARILQTINHTDLANDVIGYSGINMISEGETLFEFVGIDNGYIRGANDVDLYLYESNINGTVEIYTETFSEYSSDTFLRIFDAYGTELAYNDDQSETTTTSSITLDVGRNQIFYIGINGFSQYADSYNPLTGEGAAQGSQGDYALTIEILYENPGEVNFGDGWKNTITYTDADGSVVSVKLAKGTGTATFSGDITNVVQGKKGVEIQGQNLTLDNINLTSSNDKTSLTLKAKGGFIKGADLGSITGGSLGKLNAKQIDLIGGIDLSGNLVSVVLDDIGADAYFDIVGKITNFQAVSFADGLLRADNIGQIKIKEGDFGPDVEAYTGDIMGISVAGDITGNITAEGMINKIVTKSGNVTGVIRAGNGIGSIKAIDLNGAIISTATNIKKAGFKGDIIDSYILAGFDVGSDCAFGFQGIAGTDNYGNGNIVSFMAKGTFTRSYLGAGALPSTPLTESISLGVELPYFGNSGSIGKVKFGSIDYDNATHEFGLFSVSEIKPFKVGRNMAKTDGFFRIEYIG